MCQTCDITTLTPCRQMMYHRRLSERQTEQSLTCARVGRHLGIKQESGNINNEKERGINTE